MIGSLKAMIIIFWSPLGFPVIQALSPKVTLTSEFFVDAILSHIVAAKPAGDPGRRLVLHMDNASQHREIDRSKSGRKSNSSESSPGILAGPCALRFLSLRCTEGPTQWSHLTITRSIGRSEIARAIPRTTVERVFLEWEERLQ
jgi:hypothetical protein